MEKVNIERIIKEKNFPLDKYPKILTIPILGLIKKILHIKEINEYIVKTKEIMGMDYIDYFFNELNLKIKYKSSDLDLIPEKGPLVIVANHPLGAIDGLGLVKTIYEKRKDVKIVVNDILSYVDNLNDFFLPVDLYSVKSQRQNLINISKAFKEERVIIFFPAGKVSRLINGKVQDEDWTKGAINFARKFNTNVLPIFVDARNSMLFYRAIKIKDFFAPFLLPHEMFKKRNKSLTFHFGNVISSDIFKKYDDDLELTNIFKDYIYNIKNVPLELSENVLVRNEQ